MQVQRLWNTLHESSCYVILMPFVLFSSSDCFQTGSINPRNAIKSRWNSNSTWGRSSSLCLLLLQQHGHWLEMGWITEPLKSSEVKPLSFPLSQSRGIYVSTDEMLLYNQGKAVISDKKTQISKTLMFIRCHISPQLWITRSSVVALKLFFANLLK